MYYFVLVSISHLPAAAAPVGVVAFDPGFLPSRLAKCASSASSRLLGAWTAEGGNVSIYEI